MNRALRWYDYITINMQWFAITARSQVLTPLVIPLLVQQFVGEAQKGSYVGTLRLWTLMAALLSQALIGMVSDHTKTGWGRRKPFIFFGVIFEIIVLLAIGSLAGMEGQTGYWMLFGLVMLSMVGANSVHAATQPCLPGGVHDHGLLWSYRIKAALELPVPLIFVSFVAARQIAAGNMWGALVTLCLVLAVCMLITMLAPHRTRTETLPPLNWTPFLRLAGMTAAFTLLILGIGEAVQWVVSQARGAVLVGLLGLAGMLAAVVIGVWVSIRISLGLESLQHRSFVWWVVNRLAFLVAATNLAGFMVFFLQEKFPELAGEKAAGPAATIVMFVGIFILLMAIPSGWLADRFGKKTLVALAGLLVALGTALVVTAPAMTLLYVGGCIVGAGVGLFYSANWALGAKIVPSAQAGRFLGLQNLAGAGAGAIGAYIGGTIADHLGYMLLMSIYGAMALLSIFALLGIKED